LRVLGIDYGDRRVGLAVSDSLGLAAHGLPTLKNRPDTDLLEELRAIIKEHEVEEIVVGLPRNMDGSLGQQARKVMRFGDMLRELGVPVDFVDERLTTERAKRAMSEAGLPRAKQQEKVDRMAAQFILQLYLDKTRNTQQHPDQAGQ